MPARAPLLAAAILAVAFAGCTDPAAPPVDSLTSATDAARPQLKVHYIDVGQGDGVIWELPGGGIVLYDCGEAARDAATNPVTRYMRDTLGLAPGSTVHAVVASHGHLDHIGGCQEVFQEYVVAHVYDTWYLGADAPQSYRLFMQQAAAEGAIVHNLADDPALATDVRFAQGDALLLPAAATAAGITATILWPPGPAATWDAIAERSIVVRLSHGAMDFCFQGDIETAQEATLTGSPGARECEHYLAGHHGSNHASSDAWLARMDPRHAIVSFGENGYGHPTKGALCRIQASGAAVYATHRLGTIVAATDGTTSTVTPATPETKDYCAPGASYWSDAPASSTAPPPPPPPPPSDLHISEILHQAPGGDLAHGAGEYVEVTNGRATAVDMTGWTLRDAADNTFTFPSFTLQAGAKVRVHTGQGTDTATDLFWGRGSPVWNNSGGDAATLRSADGVVVATRSYS